MLQAFTEVAEMRKRYGLDTYLTFGDIAKKLYYGNQNWNTIESLTYDYTEVFGNVGGSAGEMTFEVTTTVGRSSQTELSETTMESITAGIELSHVLSPVSLSIEVSAQHDFSSASVASRTYERTETDSLTIDVSEPCYVYQRGVTITYGSG